MSAEGDGADGGDDNDADDAVCDCDGDDVDEDATWGVATSECSQNIPAEPGAQMCLLRTGTMALLFRLRFSVFPTPE